jgi:hypothetical protein
MQNIKQRCDALLMALVGSKGLVQGWWTSPNRAFGGSTPQSVFDSDPMKVYEYLMGSNDYH